jgi:hypothetical protein
VEGIFAHYEDAAIGRVARIQIAIGGSRGEGLVAIYKDAAGFDVIALDATGRERREWATAIRDQRLTVQRVTDTPDRMRDWIPLVRRLGAHLDPSRRPYALAAIVVQPLM